MEGKRETAVLIPYRVFGDKIFVFLQKRAKESKVLPDYFTFFGGKLEPDETPEEALKREIKEELNFFPHDYHFLVSYHSSVSENFVMHIYYKEVNDDFENTITVNEGEYGKFFSEDEVMQEPMLIESDKKIIQDLYILLKPKK